MDLRHEIKWTAPGNDKRLLDEKGFEFTDLRGKKFLVRMWEGRPWLFRTGPEGQWVSYKELTQYEVWECAAMVPKKPDPEQDTQEEKMTHWNDINPDENDPELGALFERYLAAAHALQTGIMYRMEKEPKFVTPKHLRVGIDTGKVEHAALVKILVSKGLITDREYYQMIAEGMEAEKASYEKLLSDLYGGANITLG